MKPWHSKKAEYTAISKRIQLQSWDWSHLEAICLHFLFLQRKESPKLIQTTFINKHSRQNHFFVIFFISSLTNQITQVSLILTSPYYSQETSISWAKLFLLCQILLSFVLNTPKTVPFISYVFLSISFQNTKKLKEKVLTLAKRSTKKFDLVRVVLLMKFMSLGCTMVTLRSKTLLYVSTSQCAGFQCVRMYNSPRWLVHLYVCFLYI